MRRQLFSAGRHCPYGCLYCFTGLPGYTPQPKLLQLSQLKDCTVIYPSCDGELPLDPEALARLEALVPQCPEPLVVSFSTKAPLSLTKIKALAELDRFLRDRKGFLKVSIGFTTVSEISKIEPGTASFARRLRNLALLAEYQISCAVTIKPILPFIPQEEYEGLIHKTRSYTDHYLLGDLYVDVASDFYKMFILPSCSSFISSSERTVEWLDVAPKWSVVECEELKNNISIFIRSQSAIAFDNEMDLISSLWSRHIGDIYDERDPSLGY